MYSDKSKYVGVNANTKYPEAAQALAAYLGGEECQKARFAARSIAPTLNTLAADPDVQANIAVAALSLQSGYASIQSTIPQMQNDWDPAEAFGAGIYNGEITKDNLQEQLDLFVDNFLTTPYLITQFVGNINNFNVIYFLTAGTPQTNKKNVERNINFVFMFSSSSGLLQ